MSGEPQLFRVNAESKHTTQIGEVDFGLLGLKERRHIQEWVADHPVILGEELMIIGKEFSGFDKTNERLDLLGVDKDGKLVVIELKRDDSGTDAHWQAIKYASYFRRATSEDVIGMLADHAKTSKDEAAEQLAEHIEEGDISDLNKDQRIILASHRFAPEVTNAALWLNEQAEGKNLITCVKLTPYQDESTNSLYIQANIIIPVPGVDKYEVGIGENARNTTGSRFAERLKRTFQRNRSDEVSDFVRSIKQLVIQDLPAETCPEKTGKWAAGWPDFRYFNYWYSRAPWANHHVCYFVHLRPEESNTEDSEARFDVVVGFRSSRKQDIRILDSVNVCEGQEFSQDRVFYNVGLDTLNDDFAQRVSKVLRKFINCITRKIKDSYDESDFAEATAQEKKS